MTNSFSAYSKKLVIASHNKGKIKEISQLLAPYGFEVSSAADFNLPEPEETGITFAANSEIKAVAVSTATSLPALADDSGLAVEALGGQPGVYSARWAGESKNFTAAMERIRQELVATNVPEVEWRAYFVCDLCLVIPGREPVHFEGISHGHLLFPPRGDNGFGYDPIFVPQGETRTFAQMPASEKHAVSHRAKAFDLFVEFLNRTY